MKKDNDELEVVEVEELEEMESEEVEALDEEYNEDEPITEVEVIEEVSNEQDDEDDEPKDPTFLKVLRVAVWVVPIILVTGIIYCGYRFITKATDYTAAEKLVVVFDEAVEEVIPEPYVVTATTPAPSNTNSASASTESVTIQRVEYNYSYLNTQAPEAAGYLNVLNTNIQYPVMWSADDEYFLTHSSDGKPNGNGAIFLTSSNNPDFSDSTNYIFGHNMTNGLMFRSLNNYISGGSVNYTYLSEHNAAYLVTPYETETYYIFWAEVIDPDADEYVTTGSRDDIGARAGVDIPADTKLLILVTCYTQNNSKRVLVYGYKL